MSILTSNFTLCPSTCVCSSSARCLKHQATPRQDSQLSFALKAREVLPQSWQPETERRLVISKLQLGKEHRTVPKAAPESSTCLTKEATARIKVVHRQALEADLKQWKDKAGHLSEAKPDPQAMDELKGKLQVQ